MFSARIIIATCFLTLASAAVAQIPNPDFENWTSTSRDLPNGWTTFGFVKKVSGYKSSSAIRVQRDPKQDDAPGAVVYGRPDQGFNGGVPFAGRPDSIVGFFKHHTLPGDTGWVVAILKRGTSTICFNIHFLLGSDTASFKRLAFPLTYQDTGISDTIVVGVASTNPEDSFLGSWAIVDSLHFVGPGNWPALPNANFENWTTITYRDPVGWNTTNSMVPVGFSHPVTRETDHLFTAYSVRIQNVNLGSNQVIPGYIMAGRQGQGGPPDPGFKVFGRDSVFYANIKNFPKGGDTSMIGIIMYDSGKMVGSGFYFSGDTISSWTEVSMNINYGPLYAGTPDSAAIFVAAFQGGKDPQAESVIYIDGLKLNTPMTGLPRVQATLPGMIVFPNPAQDQLTVNFEVRRAGDVQIALFDLNGQLIQTLYQAETSAGRHSAFADIAHLKSGTYVLKQTGEGNSNHALVLKK